MTLAAHLCDGSLSRREREGGEGDGVVESRASRRRSAGNHLETASQTKIRTRLNLPGQQENWKGKGRVCGFRPFPPVFVFVNSIRRIGRHARPSPFHPSQYYCWEVVARFLRHLEPNGTVNRVFQVDITELCPSATVLAQQLTHVELERLSYIGPEEFVQAFAKVCILCVCVCVYVCMFFIPVTYSMIVYSLLPFFSALRTCRLINFVYRFDKVK